MESKIQIDLAEDNQPIVSIKFKGSDDVRDKMVKSFYQALGGESSWGRISINHSPDHSMWIEIRPITPHELPKEVEEMKSRINK